MLHIFHIWKFVFRLCNVWKQGQVKVYMAQEINSEHIRLSCMGNLCQITFWRELFSKHINKFVLWECWSTSAFCSDESMTNFGNHQRKKSSKTFFFWYWFKEFRPLHIYIWVSELFCRAATYITILQQTIIEETNLLI